MTENENYKNHLFYLASLVDEPVHPNDVDLNIVDRVEKEHVRRYLNRGMNGSIPPPYGHNARRWLMSLEKERLEALLQEKK